jgi:hypothetical protein
MLVNLSRVFLMVGCGLLANCTTICLAGDVVTQPIVDKVSLEVPELIQILSIDGQEGNSNCLECTLHAVI